MNWGMIVAYCIFVLLLSLTISVGVGVGWGLFTATICSVPPLVEFAKDQDE